MYRITAALTFLFVDYEAGFWFWEVIETVRKLLLTAVLSVVSSETGVQVSIALTLFTHDLSIIKEDIKFVYRLI